MITIDGVTAISTMRRTMSSLMMMMMMMMMMGVVVDLCDETSMPLRLLTSIYHCSLWRIDLLY
jgi:hypothetical protein